MNTKDDWHAFNHCIEMNIIWLTKKQDRSFFRLKWKISMFCDLDTKRTQVRKKWGCIEDEICFQDIDAVEFASDWKFQSMDRCTDDGEIGWIYEKGMIDVLSDMLFSLCIIDIIEDKCSCLKEFDIGRWK